MRTLAIELIPILEDNYVFLIQNHLTGKTALVDPGEAQPCLKSLKAKHKSLDYILITHHHADRIDGIAELKDQFPNAQVFAPLKNKSQISDADFYVQSNKILRLEGLGEFEVIGLPGHTLGHVGYYSKLESLLFSGDVLFGLSCGRLFEGSFEMTFATLQILKNLPDETLVFCTHEYTMSNMKFVEELIETKQISSGYDVQTFEIYKKELVEKRSQGKPSVPLNLGAEKKSNPMLYAKNANDFTRIRQLRNVFKPRKTAST